MKEQAGRGMGISVENGRVHNSGEKNIGSQVHGNVLLSCCGHYHIRGSSWSECVKYPIFA